MSEDKKSLINLVPESLDNAVKNITDKPTKAIGDVFSDIIYLVFGDISQAAEKRKLKYFYELKKFENELKDNINKIPEDKRIEPDIQIIAPALEAAKYCLEKKELRELFSNLISSSINEDFSKDVHPIFTNVIKQLSVTDAKMLKSLFVFYNHCNTSKLTAKTKLNYSELVLSLSSLESLGLIYTDLRDNIPIYATRIDYSNSLFYKRMSIKVVAKDIPKKIHINFTSLGIKLCKICIDKSLYS